MLKKWNLTVTKQDVETGSAQGDANLAGAKYGIYKGDELIDTHVTDADGKFTTKYYICGNDWSIKELDSSEGYLVTPGNEKIGVDPKNYTAEYNSEAMKQYEQVKKGNIATLENASSRFRSANDRADIIRFIDEVFRNYQSWKKQNGDQVVFVVIKNLQFLDIVKSMFKGEQIDENEFLDEVSEAPKADPSNPFAAVTNYFETKSNDDGFTVGDKLLKLISDGSGFGIHFVVTSLEYQTVRECMYYGENILTKFPERIIFSLGSNDADNLIENVSVSGLRDNTVYFTDGVKNTFQMKPYVMPSNSQLQEFFSNLL